MKDVILNEEANSLFNAPVLARVSMPTGFLIVLAATISGCRSENTRELSKAKSAAIVPVDTVARNLFWKFKSKIDSGVPYVTRKMNECFISDLPSDDDLAVLLSGKHLPKKKSEAAKKTIRKSCQGENVSISEYDRVSALAFGNGVDVKVIGQSFHDQGSPKDYALLRFDSTSYAYTYSHICGAIWFTYFSDTLKPHDLLLSKGRGEAAEPIGWIVVPQDWIMNYNGTAK